MSTYIAEPIILTPKKKEKPKWQENLERTLTATAAIEAGILGFMLGGPAGGGAALTGVKTGLAAAAGTSFVAGIAKTSPKAREKTAEYIKKTLTGEFGEALGKQIETFGKEPEKSFTESIKEGWEGAGVKGALLGAASAIKAKVKEHPIATAALGAGGIAAATQVPAVKEKISDIQEWWAKRQAKKDAEELAKATKLAEEQKAAAQLAGLKQVGFVEPQPVGLGGMPVPTTPQISSSKAPQSQIKQPPLLNVIQIGIR